MHTKWVHFHSFPHCMLAQCLMLYSQSTEQTDSEMEVDDYLADLSDCDGLREEYTNSN